MKLLLVEDDAKIAAALRRGLLAEGFTVEVAPDGLEGLWRARESSYDLSLLDIMLPGRNGYRVCADLRREGDTTPILMLTAKDGDLDEAEGLDSGADDYLRKPFSSSSTSESTTSPPPVSASAASLARSRSVPVSATSGASSSPVPAAAAPAPSATTRAAVAVPRAIFVRRFMRLLLGSGPARAPMLHGLPEPALTDSGTDQLCRAIMDAGCGGRG